MSEVQLVFSQKRQKLTNKQTNKQTENIRETSITTHSFHRFVHTIAFPSFS